MELSDTVQPAEVVIPAVRQYTSRERNPVRMMSSSSRRYSFPVRRDIDVGLTSWGGKTLWLTFKPMPTTLDEMSLPSSEFSISIPQIFRLRT
jgi:hypothetical protein